MSLLQNFGIFWPLHNLDVKLSGSTVRLTSEDESGGFQTKDFTVRSASPGDNTQWQVKLVFCQSWPLSAVNGGGNCGNLTAVTDLLQVVQSLRGQGTSSSSSGSPGPMLVVDRFGGTEAATFCALHTLLRQLEFENHVDIYEYVRVSHLQRPGIWRSQDAYFFLYRILDAVCAAGGVSAAAAATAAAAAAASATASSCSSYADSCMNFQTFQPVSFYSVATPVVDVVNGVQLSTSTSSDGSNSGGGGSGGGSVATTVIRIPHDGRETLLRPTASDSYQRY